MTLTIAEAARRIESRGLLERNRHDHSERIIAYVTKLAGAPIPQDLARFYRERIKGIGDFSATEPIWNGRDGWRDQNFVIDRLLPARAVPIFFDGCGSLYGVDLSSGNEAPAVYFFDHADGYESPSYAAGSSIASFMLLLAEQDAAYRERRPSAWELSIDPGLDKCPRAPPIWLTG